MTIGEIRRNFGNFDENRPPQAVEFCLFATSCLQNEKNYGTILSHEATCYVLQNQQIAGQAHKRAVFYIVLFYMT